MRHLLTTLLLLSFSQFAAAQLSWIQGPASVPALGPFGLGALIVVITLAAVRVFRQRR